ncbi:MAG TPA: squalene/phytoene synthase family protein [Solirubrobacteraceae bacterium]|nr:squalene/phytoene synthase family protein [Solirubrobacteraceae bacterium]
MMHAALLEFSPPAMPNAQAMMDRAGGENFPVAARVLSRRDRRHLLAIYGFARLADELGDELEGDRLAALDWLEQELDRAYAGDARHHLLLRLQATLAEHDLPREPLLRLIDANRLDQRVTRYETWEQLRAYCDLSANPVGELVLCVFGLASPERIALSNRVCTALQLTEHLQDVGEDLRRDRVYLPAEDLARFGCSHEALARLGSRRGLDLDMDLWGVLPGSTGLNEDGRQAERLRDAISFETARARELLAAGAPLVASIHGRPKLAVAAFVAGGRAALDAIERVGFDVLGGVRRASRPGRLRALASVLAESRA